jgi:hypothetical protein
VRPFEPETMHDFTLCRSRGARNSTLVNAFIEEAHKTASSSLLQPA